MIVALSNAAIIRFIHSGAPGTASSYDTRIPCNGSIQTSAKQVPDALCSWSPRQGMAASQARHVLLVIDSSTRRVVSTRPLSPAGLDADAMLAEYMAYQQLVRTPLQERH